MTIDQVIQTAFQHHRAGRLPEAEKIYRQILAQQPNHADVLHLLGTIQHAAGRYAEARKLIGQAITLSPLRPDFHGSMGATFAATGQTADAIAEYRRAIELKPDLAAAHSDLGLALWRIGRTDEAIQSLQRARQLAPRWATAPYNLGNFYMEMDRLDEAISEYREAIALQPSFAMAFNNLGIAIQSREQNSETADVQTNEALAAFRRAMELESDRADFRMNMGTALARIGEHEQSMTAYRRGLELDPNQSLSYSRVAYAAHFHPDFDADSLLREARRYAQHVELAAAPMIAAHANDRSPQRRLKVGYVSPDFRRHPVARFLLPLLENHNAGEVEIYCYSGVVNPDEITERFKHVAAAYRPTTRLGDAELADQIRADRIDILVDLTLHMQGHRLAAFALKPAPVQVTWLAYAGTSGLAAMDYRLTDPYLDPPGEGDECYSEKSIRLPRSYWCYEPYAHDIEVNSPPAAEAGFVTFGSCNGFVKVTAQALDLWAALLSAVPGSRLILHSPPGEHRHGLLERLSRAGVAPSRIEFFGKKSMTDYLLAYQRIDIALDTFPYGGGTTTCDATWMGVPTVTLRGRTAVGRGGCSILSNLGLTDWIANSAEQYLSIAAGMAKDLPRLAELRKNLRARMQHSPLMNGPQFAADIEAAYRMMWKNWCSQGR